jgi:ABC-type antimicrobial peptide transport system permease subunit
MIGLYGVLSYMVARRKNEIGIRIALGADTKAVVGMIVGESARLVGVGIAAGAVLDPTAALRDD